MPDPTSEALIITGGNNGVDTVTGFRKDGTIIEDYGKLNQGRYAHACGSFIGRGDVVGTPVSPRFKNDNIIKLII